MQQGNNRKIFDMADMVNEAILKGLRAEPKYIPQWFRYDKQGSIYNDLCLTHNPDYYFHRSETSVIKRFVKEMVNEFQLPIDLVDMGSGNMEKTRLFIDEILTRQGSLRYIPVDISEDFLMEECDRISQQYGDCLQLHPIAAEYHSAISQLRLEGKKNVILWLGSLQGIQFDEQVELLTKLRQKMSNDDILLVSLDTTYDDVKVNKAYLDSTGFSALLYLNSLWRLNRDFGASINVDNFNVEGQFIKSSDNTPSRWTAFLTSKLDQEVEVPGLGIKVELRQGERLNLYEGSGLSYKYSKEQIEHLAFQADLTVHQYWISKDKDVAFCCLKPRL